MKNKLYSSMETFIKNNDVQMLDLLFFAGCVLSVLSILLIIVIVRQSILSRKYKKFMKGSDARSLEEELRERMRIIDGFDGRLNEVELKSSHIGSKLNEVFQKIGIVKYDAFEEMGGKMSFALALLSDKNTGFVINAMHSREGCYTYIKEINDGKANVLLAKEEREALDAALLSEIQG